MPKDIVSLMKNMVATSHREFSPRSLVPPFKFFSETLRDGTKSTRRHKREFPITRDLLSSGASSARRGADSDFLPFTFDFQDVPLTPGGAHFIPFDLTDGMP